jgi:Lrp/AsnC family transcriptional regulator, regulator for asnA, asnC and gidA
MCWQQTQGQLARFDFFGLFRYYPRRKSTRDVGFMHVLDAIDRAIVDLLIEDGRMSCADVARRIGGVSERSVRYRLDQLLHHRVIRVSAIANPKAVGFGVTADVLLEVEPGHVQEVARRMAEFEQVSYVACSTGERDLSIQLYARDNEELYRFVTEVIGHVPGVRRTTTLLVPVVLKDVYDWHIPGPPPTGQKGR